MTKKLQINLPIFSIIRYTENNVYDCVWKGGYTLRDALKACKKLNEDYHKNYGKYVVEDNEGKQYN